MKWTGVVEEREGERGREGGKKGRGRKNNAGMDGYKGGGRR